MPVPGCKEPAQIYDVRVREYYARLNGDTRQQGVRAHVFVVADNAYRNLGAEQQNQAVVISGESGAGKTKSAREVLRYIVELATGSHQPGGQRASRGRADAIVGKIMQNNPILEAFGNAKTLRNDNSSRFGKYLELGFERSGTAIEGAQIQTYLLEKSRVISQSKGERNFHIFYLLLGGLGRDPKAKAMLHLRAPSEYRYLGGKDGTVVAEGAYEDEVGEEEQWGIVQEAMREMGMLDKLPGIARVLSFVLLVGNVEFEDEDRSGTPWARVREGSMQVCRCLPSSRVPVAACHHRA